jgi:hypothetical protein
MYRADVMRQVRLLPERFPAFFAREGRFRALVDTLSVISEMLSAGEPGVASRARVVADITMHLSNVFGEVRISRKGCIAL